MPRQPRSPSAPTGHKTTEPRDAILVLLDIVEYTPQARAAGGRATRTFDTYFASELQKRALPHGFRFIKQIGDAALLWGENPAGLVRLMCDLFKDNPIRPYAGFTPRLRMLVHKDFFTFSTDTQGTVVDVHSLEGIILFRLEKIASINRAIVTPHLFGGLRHVLDEAGVASRAIELPADLKGVGADSPRQVYLLMPPLAEETQNFELPQPYRDARDALKDNVQFIPVFGQLYAPIPMRENFLNLTLDMQRTRGPAGYYRWDAPDLERRWEITDRLLRDSTDTSEEAAYMEKRETSRALDLTHLSADELFATFPTAVIIGLPGAGKTTMLRHFAWRAFEENPHAVVLFVEARHLRQTHVRPTRKAAPLNQHHIFRVLTTLFLFPGTEPQKLSPEQKHHIDDTAAALENAWVAHRAIVLLDALDEAPTPGLRQWLADAANLLMRALRPQDTPGSRTDLPPGRCYLSLRATELEGHSGIAFTEAPVFVVNPLDQEQIRAIARRRLGAATPLYARFDDLIWRRRDIQKVAGTPLTAMLMVFFYEVHERFARRFATYRLLVLFVLDRAWERIKTDLFGGPRQGLNPFFHEVLRDNFLTDRPGLDLQYRALAYTARRFLVSPPSRRVG